MPYKIRIIKTGEVVEFKTVAEEREELRRLFKSCPRCHLYELALLEASNSDAEVSSAALQWAHEQWQRHQRLDPLCIGHD